MSRGSLSTNRVMTSFRKSSEYGLPPLLGCGHGFVNIPRGGRRAGTLAAILSNVAIKEWMGCGWEDLALLVVMFCSKVLCDRLSIN